MENVFRFSTVTIHIVSRLFSTYLLPVHRMCTYSVGVQFLVTYNQCVEEDDSEISTLSCQRHRSHMQKERISGLFPRAGRNRKAGIGGEPERGRV